MRIGKIMVPAVLALSLAACSNTGNGEKEMGGTLVGAGLGGLAGSQIGGGTGRLVATGAGVLLGGLLGNQVGKSLDNADRLQMQQAQQNAYSAPVGQQITWNNPQSGHSGTITPTRDGRDATGNYCREFQQTINVGGQPQQGYGTACRQPDGSWKIVQ
jgi:surface antigen